MHAKRPVRLVAMQENGNRDNRYMSKNQSQNDVTPYRQSDKTVENHKLIPEKRIVAETAQIQSRINDYHPPDNPAIALHKTRIPQISETADNLAYSYYFTINMV